MIIFLKQPILRILVNFPSWVYSHSLYMHVDDIYNNNNKETLL